MFKRWRKTISVVVCFFLTMILTGSCHSFEEAFFAIRNRKNADIDISMLDKKPLQNVYPDVLKVTRCLYFGDTNENPDLKEEFMEVFYQKTGIRLEVNYPPRTNYMQKVFLMIASGELDGIVNFFSAANVLQANEDGTIEPLNNYLSENANWNSMPDQYRELYELNGQVYGISAGQEGNLFARSFRKDWLDQLGMQVPETVEDLFEVARAFTEEDPDRNGQNDTIGLTSSRFWNLQDIFQAFGALLNNTGDMSISYDPVLEVWQDSMLKPEMAGALQYIKRLHESGYLDAKFLTNEGSNMREKLWTGRAGSAFYWAMHGYRQSAIEMKATFPEAEWVEVPATKGLRTEKLNSRVMNGLCYVLIRGTNQPHEVVNTFVDILFDKEAFFMFQYGIEGKTFRWEDDTVIIMIDPKTGKPYETPGLTHAMPQFDRFRYPWCYDGTKQDIQESLNLIEIEKKMIEKGSRENTIFVVDQFVYDTPVSMEFTLKAAEMKKVFEDETAKAILGEKSIPQALSDYRAKMRALGGDKVLEEANAAIGKKPNQKY